MQFSKVTLLLHSFLRSFYTVCKGCNLEWTNKKITLLHIYHYNKLMLVASAGAMVNAQGERDIFHRDKMGGSILATSFQFYFIKLHS